MSPFTASLLYQVGAFACSFTTRPLFLIFSLQLVSISLSSNLTEKDSSPGTYSSSPGGRAACTCREHRPRCPVSVLGARRHSVPGRQRQARTRQRDHRTELDSGCLVFVPGRCGGVEMRVARQARTHRSQGESRTGGGLGKKGWALRKEVPRVGSSHGEAGRGFLPGGDRGSAGSLAAARVPAGQAGRGPCREASAGGGCGCDAAVPPATDLGVSLTRRAGPGPAHPQRAAARQAHRLRGFPRKLTGPEPRTHLGVLRTGASRNAKCLFSTTDGLSTSAFPAERAMVKRAYVKCSMCILFLSVPLSE